MMDPQALAALQPGQLLALLLFVPLVALVHEAGHALFARPAGFRLASFGVGLGRPLLRHQSASGVVFYVGAWVFAGGACVAIPRTMTPGLRAITFHAGGAIAQLALALALALLPDRVWFRDPVASFNLLVLAWNLLPWRLGGRASDGWWILARLRGSGRGGGLLVARRTALERVLRFEERVGSPVGTGYARLMLAWRDLQVGRVEAADGFFAGPAVAGDLDPDLDALREALTAEWHRARGRPLAALAVVRDTRRSQGPDRSADVHGMLSLVEARAWLDTGAPQPARDTLARLAGATGPIAADAAVVRLELAVELDDPDEVIRAADAVVERPLAADLAPVARVHALNRAAEHLEAHSPPHARRYARAARAHAAQLRFAAAAEDRAGLDRALAGTGTGAPDAAVSPSAPGSASR